MGAADPTACRCTYAAPRGGAKLTNSGWSGQGSLTGQPRTAAQNASARLIVEGFAVTSNTASSRVIGVLMTEAVDHPPR